MPLYRSMNGHEAITALNDLGYEVISGDGEKEAIFGLIVALAQEVKALREMVEIRLVIPERIKNG